MGHRKVSTYQVLVSSLTFLCPWIGAYKRYNGSIINSIIICRKIADTFNCLQGVVIFLILVVLRRRAIRGLAKASCCLMVTGRLADKLSPHDDSGDQNILEDDHTEVRLN